MPQMFKDVKIIAVVVIASLLLFTIFPKATSANEDKFNTGEVAGAIGIKMYLIDTYGQRQEVKLKEDALNLYVDAGKLIEVQRLQIVPYARIDKARSDVVITILAGTIKVDDGMGKMTFLRRLQSKSIALKQGDEKELDLIDIAAYEIENVLAKSALTQYNLGTLIIDMKIKVSYQKADGSLYEKTFNFHSEVDVVYKAGKFAPYSIVTTIT